MCVIANCGSNILVASLIVYRALYVEASIIFVIWLDCMNAYIVVYEALFHCAKLPFDLHLQTSVLIYLTTKTGFWMEIVLSTYSVGLCTWFNLDLFGIYFWSLLMNHLLFLSLVMPSQYLTWLGCFSCYAYSWYHSIILAVMSYFCENHDSKHFKSTVLIPCAMLMELISYICL